jgi:hypothetical protein
MSTSDSPLSNPDASNQRKSKKSFLFDRKSFVALLQDIPFKPRRQAAVKYSIHDQDEEVKLDRQSSDKIPPSLLGLSEDRAFAKGRSGLISITDSDDAVKASSPANHTKKKKGEGGEDAESAAMKDIANILYHDDAKTGDDPDFTDITPEVIKLAGLRELQKGVSYLQTQ